MPSQKKYKNANFGEKTWVENPRLELNSAQTFLSYENNLALKVPHFVWKISHFRYNTKITPDQHQNWFKNTSLWQSSVDQCKCSLSSVSGRIDLLLMLNCCSLFLSMYYRGPVYSRCHDLLLVGSFVLFDDRPYLLYNRVEMMKYIIFVGKQY